MWPGKASTSATRWVRRVVAARAAHALAERDAHAGRVALERTDHQFVAVVEIEADPVQLGQRVEHQRGQVGGVGDAVAFAREQAARLRGEFVVLLGFGTAQGGRLEHRGCPWNVAEV